MALSDEAKQELMEGLKSLDYDGMDYVPPVPDMNLEEEKPAEAAEEEPAAPEEDAPNPLEEELARLRKEVAAMKKSKEAEEAPESTMERFLKLSFAPAEDADLETPEGLAAYSKTLSEGLSTLREVLLPVMTRNAVAEDHEAAIRDVYEAVEDHGAVASHYVPKLYEIVNNSHKEGNPVRFVDAVSDVVDYFKKNPPTAVNAKSAEESKAQEAEAKAAVEAAAVETLEPSASGNDLSAQLEDGSKPNRSKMTPAQKRKDAIKRAVLEQVEGS